MRPESRALEVGDLPWDCLQRGERGTVLAVFSRAAYLLTKSNKLFWLAIPSVPMHRRSITVEGALPSLAVGSAFRFENGWLMIDGAGSFDVASCRRWHQQQLPTSQAIPLLGLAGLVRDCFSTVEVLSATGFGCLVPAIRSLLGDAAESALFTPEDPILEAARPLVLDMALASLEHRYSSIVEIAPRLVGLGRGLTPSGDDFLGGLLFAVYGLQTAYPSVFKRTQIVPMDLSARRTNLISATLLEDLSRGHAVAPLYGLLNALLTGRSRNSTHSFVFQLVQVGHSTGWDLLTGLLTGLLIVVGKTR